MWRDGNENVTAERGRGAAAVVVAYDLQFIDERCAGLVRGTRDDKRATGDLVASL